MGHCRHEMSFTTKDFKFEKETAIDQLTSDDAVTKISGKLEHKIGKDVPDFTLGLTYANAKIQESVGFWGQSYWTYTGSKDLKGRHNALLAYQNKYFIGSQIHADYKTKKAEQIHGVVGAKLDGNFVYFGANCLEHMIRVGFSTPHVQYLNKLAAEAQVNLKGEGSIQDKTTAKVGFSHKLNDDSELKVKFDVTKDLLLHFSYIHKVNDNLKFTFSDVTNPLGFFKSSVKERYRLGFAFEANF